LVLKVNEVDSFSGLRDNLANCIASFFYEGMKMEMDRAEKAYNEACLNVNRLEIEIKKLKEQLKEVRDIRDEIYLEMQADEETVEKMTMEITPENWREAPFNRLELTGIRGLGPAKLSILASQIETIGELQDRRENEGGLAANLPEGFGPKVAGKIEEAVDLWMRKNVWKNHDASDIQITPVDGPGEDPAGEGDNGEDEAPVDIVKEERVVWPRTPFKATADMVKETEDSGDQQVRGVPELFVCDELDSPSDLFGDDDDDSPEAESRPLEEVEVEPAPTPKARAKKEKREKQEEVVVEVNEGLPAIDRYDQIKQAAEVEGMPEAVDSDAYEEGRAAFANGKTVFHCNWTSGDRQDSWLIGFLTEDIAAGG